MKAHNTLGIYISTNKATGVCVAFKGHNRTIVDKFTVEVDSSCAEPLKELAARIASSCSERKLGFSGLMVAIDCGLYMQHKVHSDFTNIKQLAATVRYDTEEVLATDISSMALSFQVISSGQDGSNLNVFTTKSQVLETLILALQGQDIDPVAVEPDVVSLARFMHWAQASAHVRRSNPALAVVASDRNCYHLLCQQNGRILPVRAFPLGKDRATAVADQTFTTVAALGEPVEQLDLYDSVGQVSPEDLADRVKTQVNAGRWFEAILGDGSGPDTVGLAMAFGAALARDDRVHTTNLRNDFMPYQGKRLRLEKAARWASISMTILVISIGLHVQMRLVQTQKDTNRLKDRVAKDYAAVMGGRALPEGKSPVDELRREIRRIKAIRSGELSLQESVLARLTLLLKAFNNYGRPALQLDSVEITTNTIRLDGSTPNRLETQAFFKVLRESKLQVARDTVDDTAGRCTFSVILVPMEGPSKPTEG